MRAMNHPEIICNLKFLHIVFQRVFVPTKAKEIHWSSVLIRMWGRLSTRPEHTSFFGGIGGHFQKVWNLWLPCSFSQVPLLSWSKLIGLEVIT